jgi:pyruvate formate lyase activating enzyme
MATARREPDLEPSAAVLNVQRMSTEDGPGLRTTVFLKGCSLRCTWCHNPESIEARPELVWSRTSCIGAGECVVACGERALARATDGAVVIDRARCTACGECAERCPAAALEVLGTPWGLDDLVAEVAKDRGYFADYGGGVTVSGGEPGLHAPFVAPFLHRCHALGMHTAIDTCGMCSRAALRALSDEADLVLYDLKEIDPARHARLTGQSNERILANVADLAARMRGGAVDCELWIRTPLVPGATLDERNIAGIGAFIAHELGDVVTRWELCAFNNLAVDKYERLGLTWRHAGTPLLTAAELAAAAEVARRSGVDAEIVVATGPLQVEPAAAGGTENAHVD